MKRANHLFCRLLFIPIMLLLTIACSSGEGESSARVMSCVIDGSEIISGQIASGEQVASLRVIIDVMGNGTVGYTATITDANWMSFSATDFSAKGQQREGEISDGEHLLFVYYYANNSTQSRMATITVTFTDGSAPRVFNLTQLAPNATDNPYETTKLWPELPANRSGSDYLYVSHYAKMDLVRVRNYSLCFDKKLRVAHWVAYPLHASHIGSVSRSEAWAADPKIPQQYQAAIWSGSYTGSYDRGHQIPSKDRTTVEDMNEQTFYASNMTPQRSQLNQNMWAALETKVRGYVCADTLYVVTGCYFENQNAATTDRSGNSCPIPTHYYKVLLRTRSGNSGKAISECKASELKAIGFWVANQDGQQLSSSLCKSVAEIEQLTGFTFFPGVDSSVKTQLTPTDWGMN